MDLNKTNRRILREKLEMLKVVEGARLDRVGRVHTQKQIKALARRVYTINKAIEIILTKM